MQTIKRSLYSAKIVIKYASGWSCLYLAVMIISALLVPARLYLIETLIDSLGLGTAGSQIVMYIVLLVVAIVAGNLFSLVNGFIRAKLSETMLNNQLPITLKKFANIEYPCFENKANQDMFKKNIREPFIRSIADFLHIGFGVVCDF